MYIYMPLHVCRNASIIHPYTILCTYHYQLECEFGIMWAPSKDTRRRRVCSQIKEEKEEKEKEGGKEEIVNGIYILIEWRFVNWSMLIYNIPLIFIYFSTCYSIINLFTSSIFRFWLKISETQHKCQSLLKIVKIQNIGSKKWDLNWIILIPLLLVIIFIFRCFIYYFPLLLVIIYTIPWKNYDMIHQLIHMQIYICKQTPESF